MRVNRRTQQVRLAQSEIAVMLHRMQNEHELTMVEMLQAVAGWQSTVLRFMLRAERHPDDPDKGGDEE